MYYYTGCAGDTERNGEREENASEGEREKERESQVPLLLQHSAALNSAKRREAPRPASSFPHRPPLISSSRFFPHRGGGFFQSARVKSSAILSGDLTLGKEARNRL